MDIDGALLVISKFEGRLAMFESIKRSRRRSRLLQMLFVSALAVLACFAFFWMREAPKREGDSPLSVGFYHWKTFFEASESEGRIRTAFGDAKIYLRLFDVVAEEEGDPVPVATVIFRDKPTLPIVPVIYLDNEALRQVPAQEVDRLADKITGRVKKILDDNQLDYQQELQVDCDWTPSTRERFFTLLKRVRMNLPGWTLSATLRLHQLRYPEKTGIPPVDRACLMAYNMGELRAYGDRNSILDPEVAAPYLKGAPYPLPLDVALPLFSWAVVFDADQNYQRLLRKIPAALSDPKQFKPMGRFLYQVLKDQTEAGGEIAAGSIIRVEQSKKEDLRTLARLIIRSHIKPEAVLFYHLDDELIKGFGINEVMEIVGIFR